MRGCNRLGGAGWVGEGAGGVNAMRTWNEGSAPCGRGAGGHHGAWQTAGDSRITIHKGSSGSFWCSFTVLSSMVITGGLGTSGWAVSASSFTRSPRVKCGEAPLRIIDAAAAVGGTGNRLQVERINLTIWSWPLFTSCDLSHAHICFEGSSGWSGVVFHPTSPQDSALRAKPA